MIGINYQVSTGISTLDAAGRDLKKSSTGQYVQSTSIMLYDTLEAVQAITTFISRAAYTLPHGKGESVERRRRPILASLIKRPMNTDSAVSYAQQQARSSSV